MSCFQITACRPTFKLPVTPVRQAFRPPLPCCTVRYAISLSKTSLRADVNTRAYRQCAPVCLSGGKGAPKKDDAGYPWKPLENVFSGFKKDKSVEDLLRQQIEKQEYYGGDGGSGGAPPPGGGGGSGGSEDENFGEAVDEFVQVVLATMGFIFMYMYIISGEEILRLIKDFLKYALGGTPSTRLRRVMYTWGRFFKTVTAKKVKVEPSSMWLEEAIVNTETMYDSPEKYRRALISYIESTEASAADEDEKEEDEY